MSDVKRLLDESAPLPWRETGESTDSTGHYHSLWSEWKVGEVRDGTDTRLILYAVNRLPFYEAAVSAAWNLVDSLLVGPDNNSVSGQIAAKHWRDEVLAALARLREKVPA